MIKKNKKTLVLSAVFVLSFIILFYSSTALALGITVDVTTPSNPNGLVYRNMYVGQTQQLKATDRATGADITSTVIWFTTDKSVTVSNGLITAVGVGKSTVSATASCWLCSPTKTSFIVTEPPAGTIPTPTPTATNLPTDDSGTSTGTSLSGDYKLLAPLPNGAGGKIDSIDTKKGLGDYLNLMIKLFIGLCAVLSVIMMVVGGIEYMTSELAHTKESGKERILQAILGLLIALGSWALLNTINPDLLNSEFNLDSVTSTTGDSSSETGTCNYPELTTKEACEGKDGEWTSSTTQSSIQPAQTDENSD